MALYHKWDIKNGFAYALTFFSLISDGLGSVSCLIQNTVGEYIRPKKGAGVNPGILTQSDRKT